MKRLLGRLLLLAVGLAAGVVSAQPLLSYAPATDSLDRKWEWALQTIAENDNDGWLVWQVRTSLDEKIDTRNGFGYGEYIRWNSQSRYINFGGNGSWRSGLSIVAL
ncbi:MAG: hypothetical protein RL120_07210, partial [Gammaproteobacteria bacterium]